MQSIMPAVGRPAHMAAKGNVVDQSSVNFTGHWAGTAEARGRSSPSNPMKLSAVRFNCGSSGILKVAAGIFYKLPAENGPPFCISD
jgi:hypothetical protein